jgi:hypothetical protein
MTKALDRLAGEMFRTFARFEYALKAAGFHDRDAKPNWRSFAESIPGVFDNPQDANLSEAVRYILDHPPKKQIIDTRPGETRSHGLRRQNRLQVWRFLAAACSRLQPGS